MIWIGLDWIGLEDKDNEWGGILTLYNVMRKFFFFNANGNYYIYFNDKDVVGQYKYTSVRKYMHVGNSHLVPKLGCNKKSGGKYHNS